MTIKALERKVDEPITLMQHRAVQFNEVHYDESISASTTKVPQLQSDIEAAEASKVQVQGVLAKHQADRTAAKRPWPRPRRYVGRSGGVRCHGGGSQLEHSSHHEGRRCFGKECGRCIFAVERRQGTPQRGKASDSMDEGDKQQVMAFRESTQSSGLLG